MSLLRCLGNDVVDLGHPRVAGKRTGRDRFEARILDPSEREALAREEDPWAALWLYWAAKEAVFKSVSKAIGSPPPFRHALFRIRLEPSEGSPCRAGSFHDALPTQYKEGRPRKLQVRKGRGCYGDFRTCLWIEMGPGWVHALSWMGDLTEDLPSRLRYGVAPLVPPPGDWKQALRARFSPGEWDGLHHAGSALARLEARAALAAALGVEEQRLEVTAGPGRPGRRIPQVLLDGRNTPLDLTLSHHGGWVGWGFA